MAKKRVCQYTENKIKLGKLLISRAINKSNENDNEIKSLTNFFDFFEYGINASK